MTNKVCKYCGEKVGGGDICGACWKKKQVIKTWVFIHTNDKTKKKGVKAC